MYEMRPAGRGAVHHRRPFGGFLLVIVVLGFVALASSGPYFPFFPLLFVFAFFVGPALGQSVARGSVIRAGRAAGGRPDPNGKEKKLLRALERHEEITAARAALETSLGVAEAEEMLAKLASDGHVEVRASGGAIAYALRAADLRGAGNKEITDGFETPSERSLE